MFPLDIEAQIREIQGKKPALDEAQGVGLDSTGYYDQEIYGGSDSRFAGYVTSIAATELEDVSDCIYLRSFYVFCLLFEVIYNCSYWKKHALLWALVWSVSARTCWRVLWQSQSSGWAPRLGELVLCWL